MKKFCGLIIFIFLLAFLGCGSPKVVYTPVKEEPRVSAKEIEILSEKPQRPYKVVGLLEVGGSDWTSKEEMLDALKKKAYTVGADAIIDLEYERGGKEFQPATTGAYVSGDLLWELPKRKVNKLLGSKNLCAKAIRYVTETQSNMERGEK